MRLPLPERDSPGRLISLWGLMNECQAGALAHYVGKFATYQKIFAGVGSAAVIPTAPALQNFRANLGAAVVDMLASGLKDGAEQLRQIDKHITKPAVFAAALEVEARNARQTIINELQKRKFVRVAGDRENYFDKADLFGPRVSKRFKKARRDIRDSGNCLALECNTAAVFHLMRAFEWAIRGFSAELGINRFLEWSKSEQRFKRLPADFAVWERFIGQLPGKIDKRLAKLRPGKRRQALQEYYQSSYEDIKAVKDAWRNHVMHTRKTYGREDAYAVFAHVRAIMIRMASRP